MNDVAVTPADTESLPPNWCMATIGDLAEYVSRGRAPSYVDESATPVINQRCIRWRGIEFDYVKYTDDTKAKSLADEQFLRSGDVLWNSTGTGTIGRATVFRPTARFSRAVVDTHVTIVRSKAYVPELLRYWIASAEVQNQIGEMQLGSTNQVELSRERVLNTLIPLPPRPEQERIVAKIDELFSELDAGVASLKRAKALLKKYRQAVLKAAVTGELTRDWRERYRGEIRDSGTELLQRILKVRRAAWEAAELKKLRAKGKSPNDDRWKQKYKEPQPPAGGRELFALPNTWTWASVDQLATRVQYGTSAKCSEGWGIPVLRMGNIREGMIDFSELKFLPADHDEFPELFLQRGDILFNRTNSAELVGKSAVYNGPFKRCSFASYLIRVRAIGIKPELLTTFINSAFGREWIGSVVSQQVGQANVNGSKLRALKVPLPPEDEQEEIVQRLDQALTEAAAMDGAIDAERLRSERARQSILKAAFAGKLVPQDPNDEPASVLLQRIRAERAAKPRPARGRRTVGRSNQREDQLDFAFDRGNTA